MGRPPRRPRLMGEAVYLDRPETGLVYTRTNASIASGILPRLDWRPSTALLRGRAVARPRSATGVTERR